jgi:hypothetical protein
MLRGAQPVKKTSWAKSLSLLGALLIGWWALGCAITNPAGPPAPLAEVPSAISVPESVEVSVSEVGAGVPNASSFNLIQRFKSQVLPIGGEFFDAIVFGFNTNELINAALEGVLAEISQVEIPTNPLTTNFTAPSAFSDTTLKIDLADFDFFNDGGTPGCTGCSCPTGCDAPCPTEAAFEELQPICYRIWNNPAGDNNFVPLMAGVMFQVPLKDDPNTPENESNPGVGSFRVTLANQTEDPPQITSFGSNYAHRDPARPLDLSTEYFLNLQNTPQESPEATAGPEATVSFVKVQQVALDEASPSPDRLLKTIQESVNQPIPDEPDANSTFQYLARYRTDFDFWSGTFQNFLRFPGQAFAVPPPNVENFTAACAQLTTAVGVDAAVCRDIGIDVSNLPFLELLLPTDPRVNLPADFPASPGF